MTKAKLVQMLLPFEDDARVSLTLKTNDKKISLKVGTTTIYKFVITEDKK